MKANGILLFLALMICQSLPAQVSLQYEQNQSLPWHEAIEAYSTLAEQHDEARLRVSGTTDVGKPLHTFIISRDRLFEPGEVHRAGKRVVFINNGIHPGESCGIDASIELAMKLLSGEPGYREMLDHTVVVMVPVFNIGGALNRSPFNRANQNGPEEHGFRGNARNLDLNRDFVKMDSRNAASLARLLTDWKPDLLLDTHSTNGADIPYTVTLISTHPLQLEKPQARFLEQTLLPELYGAMEETPYPAIPYSHGYWSTPEEGIFGGIQYPRYLCGYASFLNTFSFTVEIHMFKPYPDRVKATRITLEEMLKLVNRHHEELAGIREKSEQLRSERREFVLQWEMDTTRYDLWNYTGYRAKYRVSDLTGQRQLYYDRDDIWQEEVPYYTYFNPVIRVTAPRYYIVPQAWRHVIDRLEWSGIRMERLPSDTVLEVEAYYIEEFETTERPYNGHYWHSDVKVRKEVQPVQLYQGDVIVPLDQPASALIVQMLEPQGYDSFFSWNFFDAVLSRKEYFSPYIFESKARQLLDADPEMREAFEQKKAKDEAFASSGYAQLQWIYFRSPYSEKTYRRYPVYRLNRAAP